MKWLLIGGVAIGALLLLGNMQSGPGVNPAFGMPFYGGFPGATGYNGYGFAMYGGFHDSHLAPRGWWKPNMLEDN